MERKKVVTLSCLCADVFDNKVTAGGETLNFAANCCHHPHLSLYIIGAVGNDEYGREILRSLEGKKIDRTHIHVLEGPTAYNRTYLTEEGDRYYKEDSWNSGVMVDYKLSDSDRELLKSADLVQVTTHSPNFSEVIECKKEKYFPLAADFDVRRDYENWDKLLPYVDFVFISGNDEVVLKAEELSKKYNDSVFIVTLAEKGSVAFKDGMRYDSKAVKVDRVTDTTGCGDSYAAGFLAEYLLSGNIKRSMEKGSEKAAETLSFIGGFRY